MKRLDLSCLPLYLEEGEKMELIDKCGKYHLLQCVPSKNSSCEGCFFTDAKAPFSCDYVMCSSLERYNKRDDVICIELPVEDEFKQDEESEMKTLTFEDLSGTKTIKEGEIFIYVDCLDVQHKIIAKKAESSSSSVRCRRYVFNNDACRFVCCLNSDRESKDDVSYEELSFEEPFKP